MAMEKMADKKDPKMMALRFKGRGKKKAPPPRQAMPQSSAMPPGMMPGGPGCVDGY